MDLRVKDRDEKGKIRLEIGWKRRTGTKATDLKVQVGPRPGH
jgi:hypothetical protein